MNKYAKTGIYYFLLWIFAHACVTAILEWPTVVTETSQLCKDMQKTEADCNLGSQCEGCRAIFINDVALHTYFDDCFEEVRLVVLVHEYTHFFFTLFPFHTLFTSGDRDEYLVRRIEVCFADLWFGRNIKEARMEAFRILKAWAEEEKTHE